MVVMWCVSTIPPYQAINVLNEITAPALGIYSIYGLFK